jgi:hypothetical protein
VQSPDGSQKVLTGLHEGGSPYLELSSGGKKVAEIAEGTARDEWGLRIWNGSGQSIGLENLRGNGHLVLADAKGISRVEAGTEQNGDGAVRVYGPTGKCIPGIAGIPCMMLAR